MKNYAPIVLKGKSANAGNHLLKLLGNACTTVKQLSEKTGRSSKGIKKHLDNLVKWEILDVKQALNGVNVYFAVAPQKKCDTTN